MTDGAITRDALLAGLQDIRLPDDAPGGALAELLAAAGLGFAAAAAAMLVLGTAALRPRLGREGAASDPPDDEARRLLLLRRLKAERPDRFAQIAGRVYRPGGLPSAEALERELARR